jgi:hypothetical protein
MGIWDIYGYDISLLLDDHQGWVARCGMIFQGD